MKNIVESDEAAEIEAAKTEITMAVVNEINKRIINEAEQIAATFPFDIQLQKAVSILENSGEYNSLLGK